MKRQTTTRELAEAGGLVRGEECPCDDVRKVFDLRKNVNRYECRLCGSVRWDERWRPVPGFEGRYEVSDQGRVRSLVNSKGNPWRGGPRAMTSRVGADGCAKVHLCASRHRRSFSLGRLVLVAFRGPPPSPAHECDHIDLDPANCALVNLCWSGASKTSRMTVSTLNCGSLTEEQAKTLRLRYAAGERQTALAREYGVGTITVSQVVRGEIWRRAGGPVAPRAPNFGEKSSNAKLSDADVIEIRRRHASGETQKSLASAFGVSRSRINGIIHGRAWSHIPAVAEVRPPHQVRGEGCHLAKLTASAVREIRKRHAGGETGRSLARVFGVSPQTVSRIIHRKIWAHLSDCRAEALLQGGAR